VAAIFEKQIELNAPANKVWELLTDFPSYSTWNSFTPHAEVDFVVNGKVKLEVYFSPDSKPVIHRARISQLDPGRKFAWKMDWGFLLRAERSQEIFPNGSGCTYKTTDVNTGLLAPLVQGFFAKKIQNGFDRLTTDLKKQAEAN